MPGAPVAPPTLPPQPEGRSARSAQTPDAPVERGRTPADLRTTDAVTPKGGPSVAAARTADARPGAERPRDIPPRAPTAPPTTSGAAVTGDRAPSPPAAAPLARDARPPAPRPPILAAAVPAAPTAPFQPTPVPSPSPRPLSSSGAPTAPPRAPRADEPEERAEVHIGTVEIRLPAPAPRPTAPVASAARKPPRLGLDEYLRRTEP